MTIWSSSKPTTPTSRSTTSRSAPRHTPPAPSSSSATRATSHSATAPSPAKRSTTSSPSWPTPAPPTAPPRSGLRISILLVHPRKSWASAPRKILIRYEDLLADPEKHFARIIDYLGGEPEPERLRRAIAFSDFKILSAQEAQHGYAAGGPAGPFFRAGKSGAWRDALTPAQAARIENDHRHVMRKFGYVD